jgi:hypothetical protein
VTPRQLLDLHAEATRCSLVGAAVEVETASGRVLLGFARGVLTRYDRGVDGPVSFTLRVEVEGDVVETVSSRVVLAIERIT